MTNLRLHFERVYEFAPAIVWDALVDADLVAGWLADARIVAEVGGDFAVRWLNRESPLYEDSRVMVFEPHAVMHVQSGTESPASLRFTLVETPGGSRGLSTLLNVDIEAPIESAFAVRIQADWLTNLDQLADLLRGHPVDWQNWQRDRSAAWAEHLGEVEADPAAHSPG